MKVRVRRNFILGLAAVLGLPVVAALTVGLYGHWAYPRAAAQWEAVGGRTTPLPKDYWPFTEADYQLCLDLIKVHDGIKFEEGDWDCISQPWDCISQPWDCISQPWDCISQPWDCENPTPVHERVQPMLDLLYLHGDRILCDELDEVAMDQWPYNEELRSKILMPPCEGISKSSLGEYFLFDAYIQLLAGQYENTEKGLDAFAGLFKVKIIESKFGASFDQVFLTSKFNAFARHALMIAGHDLPKLKSWLRIHPMQWDARAATIAGANWTNDLFKGIEEMEAIPLSSRLYEWVFVDYILSNHIRLALEQLEDLEKPLEAIRHKMEPDSADDEDDFDVEFIAYIEFILMSDPPIPYRSLESYYESRARNLMLQTALDLLDHKDAHGSFPQQHDTPPDPFNGQPLGYSLEGDGFVLHSVGGPRCGAIEWRWEPQP